VTDRRERIEPRGAPYRSDMNGDVQPDLGRPIALWRRTNMTGRGIGVSLSTDKCVRDRSKYEQWPAILNKPASLNTIA
jgi:hypothetical protein